MKIKIKGTSSCIAPGNKDPIAKAALDALGKNESLDDYIVSVYIEGHK